MEFCEIFAELQINELQIFYSEDTDYNIRLLLVHKKKFCEFFIIKRRKTEHKINKFPAVCIAPIIV